MFDVRKEVPSLELCRKLKELGYPQGDEGWYWQKVADDTALADNPQQRWIVVYLTKNKYLSCLYNQIEIIKAPTVRELGEILGWRFGYNCEKSVVSRMEKNGSHFFWTCYLVETDKEKEYRDIIEYTQVHFDADTEAEARAKMLIWLVKRDYIRFEKGE